MASDLMSPVPCNICDTAAAKYHCNSCGDALCSTCKQYHLKSKGTRHHDIVEYAQKLNQAHMAGLVCHTHNTDTPEYWCDTCSAPICGPCITKEHKGHDISQITTILSQKRDAMVEEMKNIRDSTVADRERALEAAKKITTDYINGVEKTDKDLVDRATEMHKDVEVILTERQNALQRMKAADLFKLMDQQKKMEDMLQQPLSDVKKYEDQLRDGDPNALLQFKRQPSKTSEKTPSLHTASTPILIKGESDITAMQRAFGELSSDVTTVANRCSTRTQETSNTCSATQIETTPKRKPPADNIKAPTRQSTLYCSTAPKYLIPRPSVESTFNISHTKYSHIACVDQGLAWVMMFDDQSENGCKSREIQLVDRDCSVKSKIEIEFCINGMALSHNGDILITDGTNKCIKSISTRTKQMVITTLLRTPTKTPTGICGLHSDELVVTFSTNGKVTIYKKKNDQYKQKMDLIKMRYPMAVAVNKVHQDIYICDHEKDDHCSSGKIIALTSDGCPRYEYSGKPEPSQPEFWPTDVCTDQMGHVLIADHNSSRVHILDRKGRFKQFVQGLSSMTFFCLWVNTIDVDRDGYVWVGHISDMPTEGRFMVARYLQ